MNVLSIKTWNLVTSPHTPRTVCATIGDRAFPAAAASVWNKFAGDSTCIAATTSFPQKTEDWTFCLVLQLFCLMSVSLYWLLRDPTLLLRVHAVLGLYATSSQFGIIIIIIISLNEAIDSESSTLKTDCLMLCSGACQKRRKTRATNQQEPTILVLIQCRFSQVSNFSRHQWSEVKQVHKCCF